MASVFHLYLFSSILSYGCILIETILRKFQGFCECRLSWSEKDCYFLKILKWQHNLIQEYKRGNLDVFFLDNDAKTCWYGLKISENIEIKHFFQWKSFFHHSNLLHTSYLRALVTWNLMDVINIFRTLARLS